MSKDIITIENAFNLLSEGLTSQQKYKVGSFKDFLQNVWCYSFDHPEYFKAWHVGVLADDIEDVYDANKYLQRIDNRNRMLVKWTKFGKIIKQGDERKKDGTR